VLVVSDSELTNNRSISFLEIVEQMVETFSDINTIKDSVSLVITCASPRKNSGKIIKSLDRILAQSDDLKPSTKQMLEYLKQSVHVFHAPMDEGVLTTQSLRPDIERSAKYHIGENIVNLSLSEKAIEYAAMMLYMASDQFNQGIKIIQKAIENPQQYLSDDNIFIKEHKSISKWTPTSMEYRDDSFNWFTSDGNFINLELFQELDKVLNDKSKSYDEGMKKLTESMRIFQQFDQKNKNQEYSEILQDHVHFIKQQFSYIQFFSKLLKKELPPVDKLVDFLNEIYQLNATNFKEAVVATKLEDGQKAIKCYKVANNSFAIRECFEKIIEGDYRNPEIRIERGDYRQSIGLYERAKESYHNAFSLTKDPSIKKDVLNKIANILKNKDTLSETFENMAEQEIFYNFDLVGQEFIGLIGTNFILDNPVEMKNEGALLLE